LNIGRERRVKPNTEIFVNYEPFFSIAVYLSALKFYSSLGFKRDITSPTDGEADAKYQILSKLNAELCKNHHEY